MTENLAEQSLAALLESLGSKQPTPGGGAVAGVSGAIAAATARMVVAYSLGKKSLAEHQADLERHDEALRRTRELFLGLAGEDAEAYGALNKLWKLPADDPKRIEAVPVAAAQAAAVPMSVAAAGVDLLRRIKDLIPITNRQLASDLGVASEQAGAAVRSAMWNVRANLPLVDEATRADLTERLNDLLETASSLGMSISAGCVNAGG